MNVRAKFAESNLTSLEYWGRRVAIALADLQMQGLHDGFSVREVKKNNSYGATFEIKGTFSDSRYKNYGLLASGDHSRGMREEAIIACRSRHFDFYVHILQEGVSLSPTLTFSAVGHMSHINKIGGVQKVDFMTDDNLKVFLSQTERAMTHMVPIFSDRASKMDNMIEARAKKVASSPWGVPYRHV